MNVDHSGKKQSKAMYRYQLCVIFGIAGVRNGHRELQGGFEPDSGSEDLEFPWVNSCMVGLFRFTLLACLCTWHLHSLCQME